jgi:hypothetical protein
VAGRTLQAAFVLFLCDNVLVVAWWYGPKHVLMSLFFLEATCCVSIIELSNNF